MLELRAKYDNQKKLYNEVVTQLKSVTSSDNKTPPTTPVPDTMIELREKMSLLTSQLQAYKVSNLQVINDSIDFIH